MYKNIIFSVLLALSTADGFAQSGAIGNALPADVRTKMELALVNRLNQAGMNVRRQSIAVRSVAAAEPRISVIVRMQPGADPGILADYGADITASAMGFATVKATAEQLARMAADTRVKHMSLPKKATLFLNDAHARTGVARIKSADGLVQPYTGKGVLALIEDTGLQPSHVMMQREDGTSKVEYFYDIDGSIYTYTTPEQYEDVQYAGTYHGAHTSTILAGSKVMVDGVAYEGVAPGVDMACFQMEATDQLDMAEKLLALAHYADKETARPKVVSLSVGDIATAQLDNDNDVLAVLDTLGQKMPVCVSSGNSGDEPVFVHYQCADGGEKLLLQADSVMTDEVTKTTSGEFYFSTSTGQPLKLTVLITRYGEVLYRMPVLDKSTDGEYTYLSGLDEDADDDTYLHNDTFTEQFGGRLGIASEINGCGRYVATVSVERMRFSGHGEYGIVFLVEGEGGQIIKASGDIYNTRLTDVSYAVEEGAVTDCLSADSNGDGWSQAKSVISVGAYNSRIYNSANSYEHEVLDSLCSFSSYGHLLDGRTVPYITAPGQYVVAGYNKYNEEDKPSSLLPIDGTDDYLCEEAGTSMATPYVAGTIALWLEADPKLTVAEMKEILASTAIKDHYVTSAQSVAWGHGKVDAYNGLKEVLSRTATALRPISADKDFLMRQTGRQVDVFVAGETSLSACLYNVGGALVARTAAAGDQLTLDASALPTGVYVLQVQGAATSHSAKIVIK